jgi:hypothetical protein
VREKEEKIKMFIVAATFAAHVCNNIQFVHFSGLDNKYCVNHSFVGLGVDVGAGDGLILAAFQKI